MLTFFIAKTGLCTSYSIFHLNAPHPDFIGRGQSLKWLKNICFDRSKDVPIAVLWGEGGVGKSETATFFANLHRKDFALIFWIDSETEESYSKSYFRLAKELQISFDQKASTSVVVQKVHQHLENKSAHQPWLLIFDNAQNECELPQKGKGAVLITTRNHLPWYSYPCLELLPFSEEEALTLFQKITQKAETPARRTLVKELDYYPLVLNLSAHYIADTPGMTEEDYLTLFSQNKIDLMESMPIDHRYQTDLLASWRMVADQLFNDYPDVLHWLHFCSYLCPDGISSSWLHDWLEERKKNERSFAVQLQMHDILRILVHRCLLRYDPASHKLSLHRLKQEVFKQDRYFDSATQESVLDFLLKYASYIDKRMNFKSFDELREWEPHAAWFLGNFHKGFTSEKIALLQNALGNWKYAKGEYKSAKSYLEESLKTRIALFGEEDARTLASMNGLAATLFEMEQFPEAKHFLTRSLEISKSLYGEEHPDVILALHNLGWGLWEMGQFEEAKALFAQSEEIQFLNAPESSHDLSKIDDPCKRALFFRYAGLWIEEVLGDSKKALGYFKESLNIFKNTLGEEDSKNSNRLSVGRYYTQSPRLFAREFEIYAKGTGDS